MVNILPQVDKLNRGAWLETEMIIECLRDKEAVTVIGGAVYDGSAGTEMEGREQWFVKTHGITTPTFFWKVIVSDPDGLNQADGGVIAFWMPNTRKAVARVASNYVVSITQLEANIKAHGGVAESFNMSKSAKDHVPGFWAPLSGCDRSRR